MTFEETCSFFAKILNTEQVIFKNNDFVYDSDYSLIRDNADLQDLIKEEIKNKEIGMFLFNNEYLMCFFSYEDIYHIYGPIVKADSFTNMESHFIRFTVDEDINSRLSVTSLIFLLAYNYTVLTDKKFDAVNFLEKNFTISTTNYQSKEIISKFLVQNSMEEKAHADGKKFLALEDAIEKGIVALAIDASTNVFRSHFAFHDKFTLEELKYRATSIFCVVSRSGIIGGVHPELVYSTEYSFHVQINKAENVDKLMELYIQYAITMAREVHEVKARQNQASENLQVNKAKAYIANNLSGDVSVARIAKHLGISPNYLSSVFVKAENIKLNEYVNSERIELAKKILGDENIDQSQIAFIVGFSSQSHFCNVFKKYTGMTPRQYATQIYKTI